MKKDQPKNSAFTLIFREEEHVVQLYELLTGEKLDPSDIKSVQLKDKLQKPRLYNDVSFLTKDHRLLVLIEHQSTLCGNMMFRMLEYYVALGGEFIKAYKLNKFGSKLIHIPKAEFFVVYNGKSKMPDLLPLDLGSVQVEAKVLNIHYDNLPDHSGNNSVAAYGRFVQLVEIESLHINDAIDQLLAEGYLIEFFGKKEVKDMFAEVFSYDREIFDRGLEQGIEQGAYDKAVEVAKVMLDSKAPLDDIIKFSGLSCDEVQGLAV